MPEQPEHGSRFDVEIELAQRPEVAEALAEVGGAHAAGAVDHHGATLALLAIGKLRMVYRFVVHSTNKISSTLYAWQARNRGKVDVLAKTTVAVRSHRRATTMTICARW